MRTVPVPSPSSLVGGSCGFPYVGLLVVKPSSLMFLVPSVHVCLIVPKSKQCNLQTAGGGGGGGYCLVHEPCNSCSMPVRASQHCDTFYANHDGIAMTIIIRR